MKGRKMGKQLNIARRKQNQGFNFQLALILVALIIASINLYGCMHPKLDIKENTQKTENSINNTQTAPKEEVTSYDLVKLGNENQIENGFSEGRAWVEFKKNGNPYLGVIDETGKLIYQQNLQELQSRIKNETSNSSNNKNMSTDSFLSSIKTSRFKDGSALFTAGDYYSVIVDSEGNECFKCDRSNESDEYSILGHGDGTYVVGEHIKDYAHNDYYAYVIDKSGKALTDKLKIDYYNSAYTHVFTYYGEGIFFGNNYIINVNNNIAFKIDKPLETTFYEGRAFSSWRPYLIVKPSDLSNLETYVNLSNAYDQNQATKGNANVFETSWGEGLLLMRSLTSGNYDWYNTSGNIAFSVSGIDDGVYIEEAGNYSGGCAPIEIEGKDGDKYVVALDKSGNMLYQPIRGLLLASDVAHGMCIDMSEICSNGYYPVSINGNNVVFDKNGNSYEPSVDDLSAIGQNGKMTVGNKLISGGFIYDYSSSSTTSESKNKPVKFISLDTKTVIEKCHE